MRLKKLTIQGFKSFAYKTEIKVKDGITAIVGPNGSGKSNISDAIRWVLGEQSVKSLRGNKMEDVIFSGTSTKKPLGYCEVTITFDNISGKIPLDYSEVAVTRRMFRSGESEYYLNKNSCRLKDIRELFMDTGVGKDGYSIIGQGRIDEILSNRPEDRRNIFEEAAGIVKYKSKKNEAEKKLEKTEDNLTRIKDLVNELSSQEETLKVQSNKASEFNKLHNELRELEVNLFINDIKRINKDVLEINKNKKIIEVELKEKKIKSEEIEKNFNELKTKIDELESEIESFRIKTLESKDEIDKVRNEMSISKEKQSFYNKDLKRLESENKDLNGKIKDLEKARDRNYIELESVKEQRYSVLNSYEEKKKDLDFERLAFKKDEDYLEAEKNNVINMYNSLSDAKSQLNSIVSFNENINKRITQLNNEIYRRKEEIDDLANKHKEVLNKQKKLEIELSSLNKDFNNRENLMLEYDTKLNTLTKDFNNINNQLGSKISSLKLLENMEADYEGYYRGVKSILIGSKRDNKIRESLIGVVASLFKIESKYERAIEIALGSNSQNIVTHTEKDAKILIEYLKKDKLGRITCLPRDIIKGSTITLNKSDISEFNIFGLGHELIEFDAKYRNIFEYLLGRTIIIKDIDNAIKFANKHKHRFRIITLDGELLNPGGSMSGGSNFRNQVNIINRKNKISDLKEEVKHLQKVKLELENEKYSFNDKKIALEKETEKLKHEIKEIEKNLITSNNKDEKILNETSMLKELVSKTKADAKELEDEKNNYNEKEVELKDSIVNYNHKLGEQKEKIKSLTIKYSNKKSEIDNKSNALTNFKIEISRIENIIKNLKEKHDFNNIEIDNTLKDIDEKKSLISKINEDLIDIEVKEKEATSFLKELEDLNITAKSKLESLIKYKNNYLNDFYTQQNENISINKNINDKEKKLSTLNIKLTRNSVQLENYHKRLLEDYELDFFQALKFEKEILDINETKGIVKNLKDKIKKLGNINLGSIEEYKSLRTRLEFMIKQQNDLIKARKSLNEIIKDMEEKMEKDFIISFEKINENFKEIFEILFDGGEAELVLDDDQDILNCGININAQPPGKKLQNLSLLSGGEKSLTAVALLFSILNLKPAPFCILDEIDAALDESNINKYTTYLKTLASDTQFVLITHRKATMEVVDVLYGVAMEEEGVSKLISIKLEDYIKEVAS